MPTILTITYSFAQHLSRHVNISLRPLSILILAFYLTLPASSMAAAIFAQQDDEANSLLITEVFYNTPAVDAEQEWVELANLGLESIDLSNHKIGDEEQSQGKEGMLRFPQDSIIEPGQAIVIAQTARGFYALYGHNPDYEIVDTDPEVPNMRRFALWSTGDFALANDGDELLLLDERSRIIDTVNYGDKSTYFDPAISTVYTGQSIERVPALCDTDSAADWQPSQTPAPGMLNLEGDCRADLLAVISNETLLPIGSIQGSGNVSPFVNQQVEFRGLVTGQVEDRNSAGTIYYTIFLQDPPGLEDGDPQTSDALALFLGRQKPPYQIGDLLQVSGFVTEFYGLTEIDDREQHITFQSSDNPLPETELLDLPQNPGDRQQYLEARENMLVTIAEPARVVGPTHSGCGFAIIDAHTEQPPMPRQAVDDEIEQPMLILHHSDVDCHSLPDLKSGDLLSSLVGPLTYHFDQYKIVLQDTAVLEISTAPWPSLPHPFQPTAAQFTVATFNLNNHFDGNRDLPGSAEPVIDAAGVAAKQKKLAAALGKTLGCPTIVALQEIENERLLQSLVSETEMHCGFTYEISHRESSDSRGLDLALLTDPRRVVLDGVALYQACTSIDTGVDDPSAQCPSSENPLFGRPPLRVDLRVDGHSFTIINNHFKSKRGGEDESAERRLQQSQHIANLAKTQLAADPQAKLIILGDFNDYEHAPTMLQMTASAELLNALEHVPERERYTYIFDGVPQLIDGVLISDALVPDIVGAMILHANADFPVGLASDTSANVVQFHASDHDLPLLLLNLPIDTPPAESAPSPEPSPTSSQNPTPTTALPTDQAGPAGPHFPLWPIALIVLAAAAVLLLFLWRKT